MPRISITLPRKAWHPWARPLRSFLSQGLKFLKCLRSYTFLFDNCLALGLFTSATVALFSHKILILLLHRPLPISGLVFAWPFLFVFDFITIVILYHGLVSRRTGWQITASIFSILIISLSATFASLYLEANAELNWGRSTVVVTEWKFFGRLMAQGNGAFFKAFILYVLPGLSAMLLRVCSAANVRYRRSYYLPDTMEFPAQPRGLRRVLSNPLLSLGIVSIGTLFLPAQPWRHLTATMVYDVISAISTVIITQSFKDTTGDCPNMTAGSNPFGNLNYDPTDDPFYISNLDQPIDAFIASALKGTTFTNIVHIILESMREDSFPYDENGLLHQHIEKNLEPADDGVPVTTENITPFIASLAENTISWHTVWATVPYTHKAMLGHYCGMLPLPLDWSAEIEPPAKFYQHCLPQVLRHINSVTDLSNETANFLHGERPESTDQWETAHFQSMTGEWEDELGILKAVGFGSVVDAERISEFKEDKEFPSVFGYFDEDSLPFLWQYVDRTRTRKPKNRMYLSWMDSTTHVPLILPPEWLEKNYRPYVKKTGDPWKWEEREHLPVDSWLNALKWTDDTVKGIILGFRERGLEDETLFIIHGDHGIPFVGKWRTPVENPHNEPYRVPMMLYNPHIKNPKKKRVEGNFYTLSIPTTILDLMAHTNSFTQVAQRKLGNRFAANYEHAQSLLRPVGETIRFFNVDPGGGQWVLDNGRNLRCKFNLKDDLVRLVDYVNDPLEDDPWESWSGIEDLIARGADNHFGDGTADFLREAYERQEYMKTEIGRRYGVKRSW